jgi:hypothetical protein
LGDRPIDGGFPVNCLHHPLFFDALQAPFQKIDLQPLLPDLPLMLRRVQITAKIKQSPVYPSCM